MSKFPPEPTRWWDGGWVETGGSDSGQQWRQQWGRAGKSAP